MARRVFIFRIRTNQHDRAEADNKGQNIEVAHKPGGVEHALTCFAGIADCKEAHQNVRQARRTKHQSQTQRERGDRIFHQPARLHDVDTFRVYRHRFTEQIVEAKADVFHHHKGHKAGTEQQQHGFDNLYPSGRQHAAEQDVHHHQHADQHHRNVIVKAKQQLDQFTCAHHLGDKVKRHHHQRTTGRKNTNRPLFQTVRGHIGKGVAPQVTQTFGNQEQNDRPAHQEAQRVN